MPNSTHILRGQAARTHIAVSRIFDIDNGDGTTVDDALLIHPYAITIVSARVLYTTATTGTVAAATVQVGTTVDGEQIVAATALANTKAVGTTTSLTIVSGAVPANTMVTVRHTGIAATAAGEYRVILEYTVDD
jgi:hypothetical protein